MSTGCTLISGKTFEIIHPGMEEARLPSSQQLARVSGTKRSSSSAPNQPAVIFTIRPRVVGAPRTRYGARTSARGLFSTEPFGAAWRRTQDRRWRVLAGGQNRAASRQPAGTSTGETAVGTLSPPGRGCSLFCQEIRDHFQHGVQLVVVHSLTRIPDHYRATVGYRADAA
jgi:hypothetical protein